MATLKSGLRRLAARVREASARIVPLALREDPTSEEFFDRAYRAKPDPWGFASSEFEQRRYEAILEALGSQRYRLALEPGCSIGVLTSRLAERCTEVWAADISQTAAETARQRCAALGNVRVSHGPVQEMLLPEQYDLLVFSEIGYYLREAKLAKLMERLLAPMVCGGTLLASHWLGRSPDHLLHGDKVHEVLRRTEGMRLEEERRYEDFRLDRWVKV